MKSKLSIFIFFVLLLSALLSISAYAEELRSGQGEDIQVYIEEKIVPVIMSFITSIIALVGMIKGIYDEIKKARTKNERTDDESTNNSSTQG